MFTELTITICAMCPKIVQETERSSREQTRDNSVEIIIKSNNKFLTKDHHWFIRAAAS
jgi:hypothetical protein